MANDNAQTPLFRDRINELERKLKDYKVLIRRKFRRIKKKNSLLHDDPSKLNNSESNNPSPPNSNNLFHVLLALALYLGLGTICFALLRNQLQGTKTNEIVDALYFCIVTMTTVGYGDLVPSTTASKLLSCVFVFSGTAIVGMILSRAADNIVEKTESLVARGFNLQDKLTSSEILKEVETNMTKYKLTMTLIILLSLMMMGISFLTFYEGLNVMDSFYFVCVTTTTLGYGDASFYTVTGRLFAIFWIFSSTLCLAQFFYYLTELYTERRQRALLKWVLGKKLTYADIEAADLDNDNAISAAEFIILKLKQMEKITEEDINVLMECFKRLDADESGTITIDDVINT